MTRFLSVTLFLVLVSNLLIASGDELKNPKPLSQLQQEFLDLRFGMFIHFNIPTFSGHDWPDPNQSPEVFNPAKLDCDQWAEAAVSAGMTYGCLTTKHHSGFCIWPTKTTDYNVMNSPLKRDVVKEYVDAFRKKDLEVFMYYSILDTHHDIRKGWVNKSQTQLIKDQLTELLSSYGEVACLVIDGWDAHWSKISYEEISFEEIYNHVKSIQPNCLVSEHNAGKYPSEQLFYTDVKHYEQNAGQLIAKETNDLPAQAGIPINKNWFWKSFFPDAPVKDAAFIVDENLIPLNEAHCNFILNVAPNPDGLIDDNVIEELRKIGEYWKHPGKAEKLPRYKIPIIASNLAKEQKMNSSWSLDLFTSDFANDDDFWGRSWIPSPLYEGDHFLEVVFHEPMEINTVGFVELCGWYSGYKEYDPNAVFQSKLNSYEIQLWNGNEWLAVPLEQKSERVRIHQFESQKVEKVRLLFADFKECFGVAELMVYNIK